VHARNRAISARFRRSQGAGETFRILTRLDGNRVRAKALGPRVHEMCMRPDLSRDPYTALVPIVEFDPFGPECESYLGRVETDAAASRTAEDQHRGSRTLQKLGGNATPSVRDVVSRARSRRRRDSRWKLHQHVVREWNPNHIREHASPVATGDADPIHGRARNTDAVGRQAAAAK